MTTKTTSDDEILQTLREKKVERANDEFAELDSKSLEMYKQYIKRIYKEIFVGKRIKNNKLTPELLIKHRRRVIDNLKPYSINIRRNMYGALYAYTNDGLVYTKENKNENYRDLSVSDAKDYRKIVSEQKSTDQEKDNWVTKSEYLQKLHEHKLIAVNFMNTKKKNHKYDAKELQTIQNYILLLLMSHQYFPARRSQDWTEFKIRGDIDSNNHNYLENNKMIFNKFKTAKYQPDKRQVEILKPALKRVLDMWIKINPYEYLLVDANGNKLNHTKIYQRLNKLFGKKVSVNMLRKTHYTEGYGLAYNRAQQLRKEADAIEKSLAEDMKRGGSSIRNAPHYEKIDIINREV